MWLAREPRRALCTAVGAIPRRAVATDIISLDAYNGNKDSVDEIKDLVIDHGCGLSALGSASPMYPPQIDLISPAETCPHLLIA